VACRRESRAPVEGGRPATKPRGGTSGATARRALEVDTTGTVDFAGRRYPCPDCSAGRARGLPVVVGSDAGELGQVGWVFDEAATLARGAGDDTWRELPSRRERPSV
jgi:hypothetical protein